MVGPACGDVMRLQIRVSDDGIIEDAKFKTYGCGSAILHHYSQNGLEESPLTTGEIRNTEIAQELSPACKDLLVVYYRRRHQMAYQGLRKQT